MVQSAHEFHLPQSKFPLDQNAGSDWYTSAMERLIEVVQELSHARDVESIALIVRKAARELTGADGASFVLREGDKCYYAEENAISPLWKGQRFPIEICVSGWAMLNAESVVIEDIYKDPRVPVDAYRPTFVKSLVMVPIRRASPIGAIGNYWATNRIPTQEEVAILQALADTTSVAMENAQLYTDLQDKISELQKSNFALSRFVWVASHDLREPLRTVVTQVELLERRYHQQLDERAHSYIQTAAQSAKRLQKLIEDLLVHATTENAESFQRTILDEVLPKVLQDLDTQITESGARVTSAPLPVIQGNPALLSRVFQNLVSNAIKFHADGVVPMVHISAERQEGEWLFSVSDNGIGIEPESNERIFGFFQRLHPQERYPGSGIGLATCKKIIELHKGRIWVKSTPGLGSTFYFTLPASEERNI